MSEGTTGSKDVESERDSTGKGTYISREGFKDRRGISLQDKHNELEKDSERKESKEPTLEEQETQT